MKKVSLKRVLVRLTAILRHLVLPSFIDTFRLWDKHNLPRMGAALAYYMAFSLAPLLVFILALTSLLVGADFSHQALLDQIGVFMGDKGRNAVQLIMEQTAAPNVISWETGIGFLVLLISATGAFCELRDSLNQIWDVPPQKNAIENHFKGRALSFAMIFILGLFLLASIVLSALLGGLSKIMSSPLPFFGWKFINLLTQIFVIASLFSIIYRLMPSVSLKWAKVFPGAIFSSSLFALGKFLLGWYLGQGTFATSYGATGSFLVILAWVFYSAQILYLGAAFNRAFSLHCHALSARFP